MAKKAIKSTGMKLKSAVWGLILNFIFIQTAAASVSLGWNLGSPTAAFSSITEPMVVSASDIRKVATLALPLCLSLKKADLPANDCIEGIEVSENGNNWITGTFDSYLPIRMIPLDSPGAITTELAKDDLDITPSILKNGIAGSRSSFWRFPGISHKNGELFLLSMSITPSVYNDKVDYRESSTYINLQPVTYSQKGSISLISNGSRLNTGYNDREECFYKTGFNKFVSPFYYCVKFFPFDNTNLRFRFTLNLKQTLDAFSSNSWFYARASMPVIHQQITVSDPNVQLFTLEASPVGIQIPTIILKTEAEIREYVENIYPPLPPGTSDQEKSNFEATKMEALQRYLQRLGDKDSINVGERYRAIDGGTTILMGLQDKYIVPGNTKEFIGLELQSLPSSSTEISLEMRKCPRSPFVAGLTASNATVADSSPPTFDSKTQRLTYRIAAPHLKDTGELNLGFYRFQLNPQIANCLWGNDLVGSRAEFSFVSTAGEVQVVSGTLNFREDATVFEISGFHFSSGTISIKIIPPTKKVSAPALAQTSSAGTKASQRSVNKTIVCKKGSITKRISGANPKCPVGFKQS